KRQLDESKARLKEHIATAMALPISSEVTPDSYEVVANSKVAELSDLLTKNRESLAAQLSEADKQLERTQNAAERRKTASARLSDIESQRRVLADSVSAIEREARDRGIDLSQDRESAQREIETIAHQLDKIMSHESEDSQELQIVGT